MIAAAMSYVLIMTLLLTFAGWAVERILAVFRQPRRGVWVITLGASLVFPGLALFSARTSPAHVPVAESSFQISTDGGREAAAKSVFKLRRMTTAWPARADWDVALAGFWILTSVAMLLFLATTSLGFRRNLRRWPTLRLGGRLVSITEDLGPAVFGIFDPRIILPRWLLNAHSSIRSAVLKHEQAHIIGGDPVWFAAALVLVALMPWNLPLWWQLRRLRFAIEVDCDARVLRGEIDPTAYGEALLWVGWRRSSMPLAIVAMTEPASQLEQRIRIMLFERPRYYALSGGAFLALAATFIACAARLEPPSIASTAKLNEQLSSEENTGTPVIESAAVESYFPGSLRFTVPAIVDHNSEPPPQSSRRLDATHSRQ